MLLRGKQFESQVRKKEKKKQRLPITRLHVADRTSNFNDADSEPYLSGTTDNSDNYICRFTSTIIIPQHQFPLNSHSIHSILLTPPLSPPLYHLPSLLNPSIPSTQEFPPNQQPPPYQPSVLLHDQPNRASASLSSVLPNTEQSLTGRGMPACEACQERFGACSVAARVQM